MNSKLTLQPARGLATIGCDGRLVGTEGREEAGRGRSQRRLSWVTVAAMAVAEAVAAAAGLHEWGGRDGGSRQGWATKVA